MAVSEAVLRLVREVEDTPTSALLGGDRGAQSEHNITKLVGMIGRKSDTIVEFRFWLLRLFTFLSFIAAFWFFFIHE
jgi:hypothetical protein